MILSCTVLLKIWIFVSEIHYIWYFEPKQVANPMHR